VFHYTVLLSLAHYSSPMTGEDFTAHSHSCCSLSPSMFQCIVAPPR
jgi:hypothetical protein